MQSCQWDPAVENVDLMSFKLIQTKISKLRNLCEALLVQQSDYSFYVPCKNYSMQFYFQRVHFRFAEGY